MDVYVLAEITIVNERPVYITLPLLQLQQLFSPILSMMSTIEQYQQHNKKSSKESEPAIESKLDAETPICLSPLGTISVKKFFQIEI